MTDYTKLIDDCIATYAIHGTADYMLVDDGKARAALQSAIEALQGENGQLHASLQSARVAFEQVCKHRDKLQAKLDELQRLEPVAYTTTEELEFLKDKRPSSAMLFNFTEPDQKFVALYAAPKALEPLTDDRIGELQVEHLYLSDDGYSIRGQWEFARAIEASHGITKGTP